MNEPTTLHPGPTGATRALMIGAECWALDDEMPLRSAAVPALDELDARLGWDVDARARLALRARDAGLPVLDAAEADVLAVALPVIDRGRTTAVSSLYFDVSDGARGAVEIWRGKSGRTELCLAEGKYPGLGRFARLSPHVCFPKGSGLPGLAWESGLPRLSGDLGGDPDFLRRGGAATERLTSAVALPITRGVALGAVLLMINHAQTPLFRAMEIWQPTRRGDSLRLACVRRACHGCDAVADAGRGLDLPAGDGWIGRAWANRRTEIVSAAAMDLRRDEAETDELVGASRVVDTAARGRGGLRAVRLAHRFGDLPVLRRGMRAQADGQGRPHARHRRG